MTGGTIATIAAVVAMIAIIAYAIVQHNAQVTGAAVSPVAFPSVPPPAKPGTHAPAFSVTAPGGVISSETLAGRPYLLELFATWCPHCQRMTTVLRDIRHQFPPSKLTMVSITGSPLGAASTPDQPVPEDQADVDSFDAQYKVTWPSVFDKDLGVAKAWGLQGFPEIYVVDKNGSILFEHSGDTDAKTLATAIRKALT